MRRLENFHHYNAGVPDSMLTKVERLERRVVTTLIGPASLPDSERESSVAFELKHSSGVLQFARALSRKRGVDPDTAAAGALLHDIYVIEEGKYRNHASLGAPIARAYMEDVGEFSEAEIVNAERLVANHSDKHVWSGDPYEEFGKDVDVLDCFLYPGAFDYYLLHKPFAVFHHYLTRAKLMWRDLNLPPEQIHTLLDEYEPGAWMPHRFGLQDAGAPRGGDSPEAMPPPYAIFSDLDSPIFRVPDSSRVDRGQIVAHARGVIEQIRGEGATPPVLVFPALDRWTQLATAEAIAELGDDELLRQAMAEVAE